MINEKRERGNYPMPEPEKKPTPKLKNKITKRLK